jgi:predicted amidohydrolase
MRILALFFFIISCSHNTPVKIENADLRVGVINYKITGNQSIAQILEKLEMWATKAKSEQVEFLLIPELITLDFFPVKPKDENIPNHLMDLAKEAEAFELGLRVIAEKTNITLIGASTIVLKDNKLLNRGYVVTPNSFEFQDKNYPTPWESRYKIQKSKGIKVFKNDKFKFVMLICHDAEFASISHELSKVKPDIIFVPSQTDTTHGLERVKRTSAARAIEHMSYVFMTGTTGNEKAPWHSYVGRNYFFSPQNKYFQDLPESSLREELTVFAVSLQSLRQSRLDPMQIYPARDETQK